jgi:hypothetical protein
MGRNLVAPRGDNPDEISVPLGDPPQHEKRAPDLVRVQQVQQAGGIGHYPRLEAAPRGLRNDIGKGVDWKMLGWAGFEPVHAALQGSDVGFEREDSVIELR